VNVFYLYFSYNKGARKKVREGEGESQKGASFYQKSEKAKN
jgi:hypothetical protein